MPQFIQTLFEKAAITLRPVLRPITRWHRRSVEKELRKYGLRWDDVLDDTPEQIEALKLLTREELEARQRRMHRAIDLDLKHLELPEEIQKVQAPWKPYLSAKIAYLRQREEEKAANL